MLYYFVNIRVYIRYSDSQFLCLFEELSTRVAVISYLSTE
jgi:hypothetical protein